MEQRTSRPMGGDEVLAALAIGIGVVTIVVWSGALPAGVERVGWSPLHSARTVPGAIEVALAMLDAAPKEGVTNASYWTSKGQALLWPMLFAAAQDTESTMADVVRWLASQGGKGDSAGAKEGAGEGAAPVSEVFTRCAVA